MNKEKIKTGILFGVFDGLHEGHKHLLSEASELADKIIVTLTVPEMVLFLKGRTPKYSFDERAKAIKDFNPHIEIVPSDPQPGAWSVLQNRKSYVVILGYDQQGIAKELEKTKIPFVFVGSHHPEKYKSSLLT